MKQGQNRKNYATVSHVLCSQNQVGLFVAQITALIFFRCSILVLLNFYELFFCPWTHGPSKEHYNIKLKKACSMSSNPACPTHRIELLTTVTSFFNSNIDICSDTHTVNEVHITSTPTDSTCQQKCQQMQGTTLDVVSC